MSYASGEISVTPKHCKGCIYRETSGISKCLYSIITGKLRNCPVDECPHKIKKGRRNNRAKLF